MPQVKGAGVSKGAAPICNGYRAWVVQSADQGTQDFDLISSTYTNGRCREVSHPPADGSGCRPVDAQHGPLEAGLGARGGASGRHRESRRSCGFRIQRLERRLGSNPRSQAWENCPPNRITSTTSCRRWRHGIPWRVNGYIATAARHFTVKSMTYRRSNSPITIRRHYSVIPVLDGCAEAPQGVWTRCVLRRACPPARRQLACRWP